MSPMLILPAGVPVVLLQDNVTYIVREYASTTSGENRGSEYAYTLIKDYNHKIYARPCRMVMQRGLLEEMFGDPS